MKTKISLALIILVFQLPIQLLSQEKNENSENDAKSLHLVCTPELSELTQKWVDEYQLSHTGTRIELSEVEQFTEIAKSNFLGFTSKKDIAVEIAGQSSEMVIGRQITVPLMNSANPFSTEIGKVGLSAQMVNKLLAKQNPVWGDIIGNSSTSSIHFIVLNDPNVVRNLQIFSGLNSFPESNIRLVDQMEFTKILNTDPLALGFCSLNLVPEGTGQNLNTNVSFVPIDKNANGLIDKTENIYSDAAQFNRNVWIGKYPKSLVNNIYSVTTKNTLEIAQIEFLQWVVTNGQDYLENEGFTALVNSERQSRLASLSPAIITQINPSNLFSLTRIIVSGLLIVLGAVIFILVFFRKNKTEHSDTETRSTAESFNLNQVQVPKGLYYDNTHTWLFMEKNGHVKLGLDDFLQHITGSITRVEMKNIGDHIRKGEVMLTLIQNGKKLHIHAPVNGIIQEKNEKLLNHSEYLSSAPFEEGWVYQIEPSNWMKDVQLLFLADRYSRWLKDEFLRLKDFLATLNPVNELQLGYVVLQDGGNVKEHVLDEFGPEIWEEFQEKFLDVIGK